MTIMSNLDLFQNPKYIDERSGEKFKCSVSDYKYGIIIE